MSKNVTNNPADISKTDLSKRQFLSGTVTGSMIAAGVSIAPGVFLTQAAHAARKNTSTAVTSNVRWGIVIDTTKNKRYQ